MKKKMFSVVLLGLGLSIGCGDAGDEEDGDLDTASDAVTSCSGRVPDRTASTVGALPFQTLNRGETSAAIKAIAWGYPTRARTMPNNFGAGRSYNEGHEGADLGGGRGDPILASATGKVVYAQSNCPDNSQRRDIVCGNGWGNHVVIDHGNGVHTRYAHLSKLNVQVGSAVTIGQTIGALGHSGLSDGPHLHFELGTRARPFDHCKGPQNFDAVYNPAKLTYGAAAAPFRAERCVVTDPTGGNARKTPNGEILIKLNKGASVFTRGPKEGQWYPVGFTLQSRDWQAYLHDSTVTCGS